MNTPMNIERGQHASGMRFDAKELRDPEFLHKAQHDIRTAMHVVTGMTNVLSMSRSLTASDMEAVAMLKRNADKALALIEGMFDALEQREVPPREPRAPGSFS